MLLKSEKNITDLIIGAAVAVDGTGTNSVTDLTSGQWALAYENGLLVDTGTTDTNPTAKVRFVMKSSDGTIISTPFIKRTNAKYKAKNYSAPAEQISYFGYVGSGTETIEAIDNNDYLVRVLLKGVTAQYGDKMMYKYGAYRSSNSATMREVALGLASNLTSNFKRERIYNGEQLIKFEVLTEFAAGSQDMAHAVVAVNGDTVVNVATDLTYVTGTLAVGDYMRFDAIGGATPGPTDGVYKITAISTLAVTLDRPFELASGTYGATDVQAITAVQAAATTYWGVRCTGIARSKFEAGRYNYETVRFELQLADFGTTVITESTRPTEGNGYYKELKELEWDLKGNRFNGGLRLGVPPPTFTSDVSSTTQYALFTITYYDDSYDAINGTPKSPASVIIAVPTADYAATNTDIGTDWVFPAA
jgi:hypothetical protein